MIHQIINVDTYIDHQTEQQNRFREAINSDNFLKYY